HAIEVFGNVLPERLHVGEVRGFRANTREIVQRKLDTGLIRDREEVEYRVRRSAEHHRNGDRVLERLLRENVARRDPLAEHLYDSFTREPREIVASAVRTGGCRRTRKTHPERLRY